MLPKCKIPHFPYPRIGTDYKLLSPRSATTCSMPKLIQLCADFHFLMHYVITIHQRYRRIHRRHARSISTTCYIRATMPHTRIEICTAYSDNSRQLSLCGCGSTCLKQSTKWRCHHKLTVNFSSAVKVCIFITSGNHILTLSTYITHQWSLQWLHHLSHVKNDWLIDW